MDDLQNNDGVTYFAKTNFRNSLTKFGIKRDDRRRHMYIIGKTGMGKTTLMENMILSDIYNGNGCCYIDPHGDTAETLIDFIPSWRINDVVYFNPADLDYPIGFNIFEAVDERYKHLVASGMMGVFKKIWENMWSSRMEYILNNTILALLDNPGSTMLGINRMLAEEDYRRRIVGNVKDPIVKQFWIKEFAQYEKRYAKVAVAPIQNKIGQFLSASIIRNIVAQVKSTIDIRRIMDEEKIFIVNLSKGRIGEDNARLLGGLLITKIQLAAMERVDVPEEQRKDFYLYVDEFQNFAVESFASILSEARKYRLALIMAHQYIAQLTEEVRDAVFGNVGTMVTFRVGAPDAEFIEQEFATRFTMDDIINLPKFNIYLKLLIDGVASQPFSAQTLPPIAKRSNSAERVIRVSRERYARKRVDIEDKIMQWSGMETVDTEEALDDAKQQRKNAKKPMHDYTCDKCDKDFQLPVELDRDRDIFCKDCLGKKEEEEMNEYVCDRCGEKFKSPVDLDPNRPTYDKECLKKVREEGDSGKHKKKKKQDKPNPSEGEVVQKDTGSDSVSLSDLNDDKKQEGNKGKKKDGKQNKNQKQQNSKKKKKKKKKKDEHDYVCDTCGKEFTLPFELNRDRPIYCKPCLNKQKNDKEKAKQEALRKSRDDSDQKDKNNSGVSLKELKNKKGKNKKQEGKKEKKKDGKKDGGNASNAKNNQSNKAGKKTEGKDNGGKQQKKRGGKQRDNDGSDNRPKKKQKGKKNKNIQRIKPPPVRKQNKDGGKDEKRAKKGDGDGEDSKGGEEQKDTGKKRSGKLKSGQSVKFD